MKVRHVNLYSDDALTGTTMLDDAEMGVYVRIWLLIYSTGGRITFEQLRSVCKSHGNALNRILARLEELGKIQIVHREMIGKTGIPVREIGQKRCENELERTQKRSTKGSQNAAIRWKTNGLDPDAALLSSNPIARVHLTASSYEEATLNTEAVPNGDASADATSHPRYEEAKQETNLPWPAKPLPDEVLTNLKIVCHRRYGSCASRASDHRLLCDPRCRDELTAEQLDQLIKENQ